MQRQGACHWSWWQSALWVGSPGKWWCERCLFIKIGYSRFALYDAWYFTKRVTCVASNWACGTWTNNGVNLSPAVSLRIKMAIWSWAKCTVVWPFLWSNSSKRSKNEDGLPDYQTSSSTIPLSTNDSEWRGGQGWGVAKPPSQWRSALSWCYWVFSRRDFW